MKPSLLITASLRNGTRLCHDQDVLVPWWSITKSIIACAVLRLAEMGAVPLDCQFEDWPFTVRQLLQHTAGLADYGGPAYQEAVSAGAPVWRVEDLLRRLNARALLFSPGEGWAYSNAGYLLLRQLIERSMDCDLDSALKRLVFSPLGIERTRVANSAADFNCTVWGNPSSYDPRWVFHGLLIGPPGDAVTFLAGLLQGVLLSAASMEAMLEARLVWTEGQRDVTGGTPGRPWTQISYGLGLMTGTMSRVGRAVGHSGEGPDSVSALYDFPDLPGHPTVAAFAHGSDQGMIEHETIRCALRLTVPSQIV